MYVIIRSFFNPKNKKVKTKIVRLLLLILLATLFVTVFYGSFVEPNIIKVKNISLNFNKTQEHETIKIAFASDIHVGPYKKEAFIEYLVRRINKEQTDFIFLGGDMLFGKEFEAKYLRPLQNLDAPTFAVTGNHEYNLGKYGDLKQLDQTKLLRENFQAWGIEILDNETQNFNYNNITLSISGIKDLWTGRADLKKVRDNIKANDINVLIAHNPDVILDSDHEAFDLILSGHTHAGQIRLPFIGALMGVPTILGRKYDHGLWQFDKNHLYISSGLGESGPRARLFNPPELTIIEIDL